MWAFIGIAGVAILVFVLMMIRCLPETPLEEQAECLRIQEREKAEKQHRKAEKRQRRRETWRR